MDKNISLVLSGGGARGIAHIGVIEELEKQGFQIKSIAGTSMGAVVGGVYAAGKMEEFKNWIYGLDKFQIFKLIDFSFSAHGLIKGDKIFTEMKKIVPDINIEDLEIPFTATATEITKDKEVVFSKGNLYNAIRASVSIPTVFVPVKTKDGILVDGGILNNIPLNNVKRTPNDLLVAVLVNADIPVDAPFIDNQIKKENQHLYLEKTSQFKDEFKKKFPAQNKEKLAYFDLITKTIHLLIHQTSILTLEKTPPDMLIKISKDSCGLFDFYKAKDMVEIGKYNAIKYIEEYKKRNK